MAGGGWWSPAEWTDDTQMSLLVAESLLDRGGIDEDDLFGRFVAWSRGHPKDIGAQTSEVLRSGLPWTEAAEAQYARSGMSAGNGSLMRTTPAAIFFASQGRQESLEAARRISALTHGDPTAGDGCAIFHELLFAALEGADPASFPGMAAAVKGGRVPANALIMSLSRTFGQLDEHRPRRQIWMIDQAGADVNLAIGQVLDDVVASIDAALDAGSPVIVHCHGGRSRTGLLLRAWMLAHDPSMTIGEAGAEVAARWPHSDLWNQAFTSTLADWTDRRRS